MPKREFHKQLAQYTCPCSYNECEHNNKLIIEGVHYNVHLEARGENYHPECADKWYDGFSKEKKLKDKAFRLSRVCTEFDRGKWRIHQFGYDYNGKYFRKKSIIKDYFYYLKDNIDDIRSEYGLEIDETKTYAGIYGEQLYKVHYRSIKTKNKIVKSGRTGAKTHMGDVSPAFKHILNEGITWSDKRNVLLFDIETDVVDESQSVSDSVNTAEGAVTSIVGYSSFKDTYYVISWHPEETKDLTESKIVKDGNIVYIYCKDEIEVLLTFIRLVRKTNTDILSGWYSSQYDLPYIINRCERLGLPYEKLSPIGKVRNKKNRDYWRTRIEGLDHVDMMDAIKDLGYKLSNYKLDTAAKEIVKHRDIEKEKSSTWRDWKDNYEGFIKYAFRDVEILKEINDTLRIFDIYVNLQQIANIESLNLVFLKSVIVDNYMMTEFYNKGELVFPTRQTVKKQKYAGALVINPTEPGNHEDVTVLDYTSLYPTTVMAFNISPETFVISEKEAKEEAIDVDEYLEPYKEGGVNFVDTDHSKEIFGKRYIFKSHTEQVGLFPIALKKLFKQRIELVSQIKSGKLSAEQEVVYEKKQKALKMILNSAYGAMGFNYFRLYKPECADAITYFARKAFKYAILEFNKRYKVLYGDTDSIMFKRGDKSLEDVYSFLNDFNDNLKSNFVKPFNPGISADYMMMDLKFEKDLKHAYFGNSKKRYYGIEDKTGKKYIRGLNIIRKDAPSFIKDKLNSLAELSVKGQLTVDDVRNLRREIESIDYSKIGITKNFTKRFVEYIKNKPQHLKASLWANEILGTNVSYSDNPYLFYVVSLIEDELKPKKRHKAVCLLEEDLHLIDKNKDKFVIDYNTFFKKQVVEQLDEFRLIENVDNILNTYEKEISNSI